MSEVLLLLSVLPSIVLGVFIYKMDKVEKEPPTLLLKLFVFGILAIFLTLLISIIAYIIFPILESTYEDGYIKLAIATFIGVGLIEEGSKWLFLKVSTWNDKNFTHIYDALIYAVFISLGFATLENILYVLQGGIGVAIMRAVLSVPGHVFFAVFMGYYYGIAKQAEINKNEKIKRKNLILSIVMPFVLHGTFDFCLLSRNIFFVLGYFLFVIFLYISSFSKVFKFSKIVYPLRDDYYCKICGNVVDGAYCTHCGTKKDL